MSNTVKTEANIKKASKVAIETATKGARRKQAKIKKSDRAELVAKQKDNPDIVKKSKKTPSPLKRKTTPRAEFHDSQLAIRYAYKKAHKDSYIGKDVRYINFFDATVDPKVAKKVYQKGQFVLDRLHNVGYCHQRNFILASKDKVVWQERPIAEAVNYPFIRVNPTAVCYYLIVDVDNTSFDELMVRFKEIGVYPHFMIGREGNKRSWHLWFGLQYSEYRTWHVLKSVVNLLTTIFFGDPNYTNSFSRSPFSPSHMEHTYVFDLANYDIDDLDRRLQIALDHRPEEERLAIKRCIASKNARCRYIRHILDATTGSRNVDTFLLFTKEARDYIFKHMLNDKRSLNNQANEVIRFLLNKIAVQNPYTVRDLSHSELKTIAKSVVKYNLGSVYSTNKFKKFNRDEDGAKLRVVDQIIEKMLSEEHRENILELAADEIKARDYEKLCSLFECSKDNAQYAIRIIRAMFGIRLRNYQAKYIEDPVLEVKRARYEAKSMREITDFERVKMRAELKKITKEGRKIRKLMRSNGLSERQVQKRLSWDNEERKAVKEYLQKQVKHQEWQKIEKALMVLSPEERLDPKYEHALSEDRYMAILQQSVSIIQAKYNEELRKKEEKEASLFNKKMSKKKKKDKHKLMNIYANE